MQLLIVIVNYRSTELTLDCLRSLEPEVRTVPQTRVVVVEGGSGDDSADVLAREIEARGYAHFAELLVLAENRGFAYGNNAAIRRALESDEPPEYIYLLNPDTVVHPGALRALVRFMELHPRAGIAGSRCENPDGSVRRSAFRFHSILGELEHQAALGPLSRMLRSFAVAPPPRGEPHRAHWVSGAAMLVRKEVFDRIGLLDDRYFLYFEETDFARRAAEAGYECWYVPKSRIVHYCGKSSGVTGERRVHTRVPAYWYDSRRRYFEKHHGAAYRALADLAWISGASLRRLRALLGMRRDEDPPHQYVDFIRYAARARLRGTS